MQRVGARRQGRTFLKVGRLLSGQMRGPEEEGEEEGGEGGGVGGKGEKPERAQGEEGTGRGG